MVDAGDDQVRALAEQAQVGEADAVDRRPVGGVADACRRRTSTSSTQSGERVVMLRAVALRLESGAMT